MALFAVPVEEKREVGVCRRQALANLYRLGLGDQIQAATDCRDVVGLQCKTSSTGPGANIRVILERPGG